MKTQKFVYKAISVEHRDQRSRVKILLTDDGDREMVLSKDHYINLVVELDHSIQIGDRFKITVESLPRSEP